MEAVLPVGLTFGVSAGIYAPFPVGILFGAAAAILLGVVGSADFALTFGVTYAAVLVPLALRLLLAPIDVTLAVRLMLSRRAVTDPGVVWSRHPGRWDPHGLFPLPGLGALLTSLQLHEPVMSVGALRLVARNPVRRPAVARAVMLFVDATVGRVEDPVALAALAADLDQLASRDLLSPGERAELDLLSHVSRNVSAALVASSMTNRVARLREAKNRVRTPNPASRIIAQHRGEIARVVETALKEAELELSLREPVPQVFSAGAGGNPLGLESDTGYSTFKGRTAIFEQLETSLGTARRATVILHGPRRLGKTSILKQLPERLGPSVIPIFVDLQSGLGIAESASTLLSGLAHNIVEQARTVRRVSELPRLAAQDAVNEPYVAFAGWLDLLEAALRDRHVLLCLDEFEMLEKQMVAGRLDTRILDLFRGIVQHRTRMTIVLTGVNDLTDLPPSWASTLVSAQSIEVGPLAEVDARELIEHPVPGFPRVYSDAAVDAILAATGCQPFMVQVTCSVLVEHLNERRWKDGDQPLTPADVAAATPKSVERAENYLLELWRNYVPDAARDFLRTLARQEAGRQYFIDDGHDELVEAILFLERVRVLRRTGGGFALAVPTFGEYIRLRQSVP